jgi:hypothetical protein
MHEILEWILLLKLFFNPLLFLLSRRLQVLGRNCRFLQGPVSFFGMYSFSNNWHVIAQVVNRCTTEIVSYVSARHCQKRWRLLVKEHPHLQSTAVEREHERRANTTKVRLRDC